MSIIFAVLLALASQVPATTSREISSNSVWLRQSMQEVLKGGVSTPLKNVSVGYYACEDHFQTTSNDKMVGLVINTALGNVVMNNPLPRTYHYTRLMPSEVLSLFYFQIFRQVTGGGNDGPQFNIICGGLTSVVDLHDEVQSPTAENVRNAMVFSRNVSAQLLARSFPCNIDLCTGCISIPGSNCQRLVSVRGGLARDADGFARVIERPEQSGSAEYAEQKRGPSPVCSVSSGVCGLPLGAKIGIAFLLALAAWPLQFRALGLFDGLGGRKRNRWRALACFSLSLGLFALAFGAWLWGGS